MGNPICKFSLAIILAIILIMPLSVSAATTAGIIPTSHFYFLDTFFEKINLFFTFSPEKKAQKAIGYAGERLAETEDLAEKNKPDLIMETMSGYESSIQLAEKSIKNIKDNKKIEELLNSLSENTSKHQEVLVNVYNKVPNESKEAIEKAIDVSLKAKEEATRQIAGLNVEVTELQQRVAELEQKIKQSEPEESGGQIKSLQKQIDTLQTAAQMKEQKELTNAEIVAKVKPAVVYIKTTQGAGSGMIIESDGYILTNAHVVENVDSATVKLTDGRLFIGSIVGRDEKADLALLKINANGLPKIELGNSSENILKQGDRVFTMGYPFGLEGEVSFKEGTISRRHTYGGVAYLETSAEIHPGNSGGPLVNIIGEAIGVNTVIFGEGVGGFILGETIKFALPINFVRGVLPELKAGKILFSQDSDNKQTVVPQKPLSPTPSDSKGYPGYPLKYNPDKYDPNVIVIQEWLLIIGYGGRADGYFKSETFSAVVDFQTRKGLIPAGYVDQETWNLLYSSVKQLNPQK